MGLDGGTLCRVADDPTIFVKRKPTALQAVIHPHWVIDVLSVIGEMVCDSVNYPSAIAKTGRELFS